MKTITVAAAIISNTAGQLLVVRKHQTQYFMQVGGKLEANESAEQSMLREIAEEIGVEAEIEQFVGRFETAAANEADHLLVSYVYQVRLLGIPNIAAEIAEMQWIHPDENTLPVAPLTTEVVIPWYRQQSE
jgi:8-oxo-dGTP diphosphatase